MIIAAGSTNVTTYWKLVDPVTGVPETSDSDIVFCLKRSCKFNKICDISSRHNHIAFIEFRSRCLDRFKERAARRPYRFIAFLSVRNENVERSRSKAGMRRVTIGHVDFFAACSVESKKQVRV